MKRRLLALLVAAACGAAATVLHLASPRAHAHAAPIAPALAAPIADDALQQTDGGWWDWDKQYL